MERPDATPSAPHPTPAAGGREVAPAAGEAVPHAQGEPKPDGAVDASDGGGLWVAILLGVALVLALCIVLMLLASSRGPAGAAG